MVIVIIHFRAIFLCLGLSKRLSFAKIDNASKSGLTEISGRNAIFTVNFLPSGYVKAIPPNGRMALLYHSLFCFFILIYFLSV